jgi:K+-transporting ATPase ATPase C chain
MNKGQISILLELLRPALVVLALLTVLTGLLYPAAMTGLAQIIFPDKANGSIITRDGQAVGSALIGQPFDDPRYFWGRLSATGLFAYNAAASSGSNYGPTNPALFDMVQARIDALKAADPDNTAEIPIDLVTASASGLDPHISPAAAEYQIARVAHERELDESVVRALVEEYTEERQLGILGEPRVNVLELNLALDELQANGE